MGTTNPQRRLKAFIHSHGSRRVAAAVLGVSENYVFQLLSGRRAFSDNMLSRIGLERVERFQEKSA